MTAARGGQVDMSTPPPAPLPVRGCTFSHVLEGLVPSLDHFSQAGGWTCPPLSTPRPAPQNRRSRTVFPRLIQRWRVRQAIDPPDPFADEVRRALGGAR